MNTVTINLEEYLKLKEFKEKVSKGNIVMFTDYGQPKFTHGLAITIPETCRFVTENLAIIKIGEIVLAAQNNLIKQKEELQEKLNKIIKDKEEINASYNDLVETHEKLQTKFDILYRGLPSVTTKLKKSWWQ